MLLYLKLFIVVFINFFNINESYKYKYDLNDILNNIIITKNSSLENITNNTRVVNETINELKLINNSYITPLYLRRKSKFCNIKCNCFFSHSVKNDNICLPYWIKPSLM